MLDVMEPPTRSARPPPAIIGDNRPIHLQQALDPSLTLCGLMVRGGLRVATRHTRVAQLCTGCKQRARPLIAAVFGEEVAALIPPLPLDPADAPVPSPDPEPEDAP